MRAGFNNQGPFDAGLDHDDVIATFSFDREPLRFKNFNELFIVKGRDFLGTHGKLNCQGQIFF